MDYLLKASAILAIFYLFYRVVLHRETFFQSNRIFLLTGIIASLTLPLIVIPIYVAQTVAPIQDFVIAQTSGVSETPLTINWIQIIVFGYLAGILFFGTKFFLSLLSLVKILISSKKEKVGSFYFIKSKNNDSPFSFFNYIVYNPTTFQQQELEQILMHEKVHAYQWHSFDVLFSQLATIVFWFNPISWLYKNALQQNLEFIADAVSQEKSSCQKSYQQLLLKTSIAPNQLALTNNFYNSLIKKRIIMLHKNRSKNTNQWKFAFILPLLTAFIFTFNTKTIAQTVVDNDDKEAVYVAGFKVDIQMAIIDKDSKQLNLDEIKSSFAKEGVTVKFKGIKRNNSGEITAIKINVNSKQSNASFNTSSDEPIKPIKISFNNDGNNISIGNSSMRQTMKDIAFGTTDNKKQKIQLTGNYVFISDDGKVSNGTIDFDNDATDSIPVIKKEVWIIKEDESTPTNYSSKNMVGFYKNDNSPIFYIDGKKVLKGEVTKLNPKTIKNIVVLKDKAAVEKYGDEAKDGAVLIYIKNENTENNSTLEVITIKSDSKAFISDDDSKYLIYIDGTEATKEDMEKINPDNIEKMNVLKGEAALKLYGDKGKNGVIEITTKKK